MVHQNVIAQYNCSLHSIDFRISIVSKYFEITCFWFMMFDDDDLSKWFTMLKKKKNNLQKNGKRYQRFSARRLWVNVHAIIFFYIFVWGWSNESCYCHVILSSLERGNKFCMSKCPGWGLGGPKDRFRPEKSQCMNNNPMALASCY